MTIHYLNPVQEAEIEPASLAPRLESLQGITLGLLSNGKTNAERLLKLIAEELNDTFNLGEVIQEAKGSAGINCPRELLENLVARCDAVITGMGD